jgi:NitT/TauT family transport system ATP-binding protein
MDASYTARPVVVRGTDVAKSFDNGTVALAHASFEIRRGEFVSLVGPSGCGKSTLLRMLAGLDSPTGGTVSSITNNIGYIFQDATLLPWRTTVGNVELPLRLSGMPKTEARLVAADALARVGLSDYHDHRPAQLSGGMRMRVSIARALTGAPELFLFDEPFGALDEITRQSLNEELDRLMDERSFTGIFVTHSVAEAVYLSDRVLVFSKQPGRIVADIPIDLERPRHQEVRFSAEFARLSQQVSEALSQASRTERSVA